MSVVPTSQILPVQLNELSSGFGNFTLDLYQQCSQSTGDNIIFSPISILSLLALASQASNGNTFNELKKGLYLNDDKTLTANQFNAYNSVLKKSIGNSIFSMANQIYAHEKYSLNKSFQEIAVNKFSSGIESVNFAKSTEVAQMINNFVEEKTHSKIRNLIDPAMLNDDTRVVLVNAIYFKSDWLYKFDRALTKKGDFYTSETETVPVCFMNIESNFRVSYFDDLDAKSIELKYANSTLSFVIVLPNERTGLAKLEDKLTNYSLTKVASNFRYPSGYKVVLPKFKVEFQIKLNNALKNLGMVEMFDKQNADFSGLLETNQQIYVSDVIHKAFIEINEEGSEAAAADLILFTLLSSNSKPFPPEELRVDHPFLYYIWDTETKTAIFSGRITKPNLIDQ